MIIRQLNLVAIREEREKVEKGLRKPLKCYSVMSDSLQPHGR